MLGVAMAGMLFVVRRGATPMAGGTIDAIAAGYCDQCRLRSRLALLTALATEGQLKTLSFWMLGFPRSTGRL